MATDVDTVRRLTAVFRHELPDRVPVVCVLALPFVKQHISPGKSVAELHSQWIEDPVGSIVKMQEELGLDPVVVTKSLHFGEVEIYPRKLFTWPPEALVDWREEIRVERQADSRTVFTTVFTPAGKLTYAYRIRNYSLWPVEHLLKEESDLRLLEYRPDPRRLNISRVKRMVTQVGTRGFFTHIVSGVWNEACELRGVTRLFTDVYDRAAWVKDLLVTVKEYLVRHVKRLAETGVHSICLNESWLGMGLSPRMYEEFIFPYDQEVVKVAQELGIMVSYHNCGRGSHLLEQMVGTGADALETLTPSSHSGDFELADVKSRVGDRICLFGGFDERVLLSERSQAVRDEVRRCIDAAATGGGYILRPAGQVIDANPRNVEIMARTVRDYGTY